MNTSETLLLSNEPLSDSETTITLDILSDESSLRRELDRKKVLEGKITYNPKSCHIFFLPPAKRKNSSVFTPDRTKWDLYLIGFPFTLHPAPGERYYKALTCFIELADSQATAFDLFPKHVATKIEETKSYTISPHFKIAEMEVELGQISREIRFTALHPTITAFGEGESTFYWVYKGFQEQKEVIPETKYALIVLQVLRGTQSIGATISYEVDIARRLLGAWRDKESTTDPHPIQWDLSEAKSFV